MKFKIAQMVTGTVSSIVDDGIYVVVDGTKERGFIHVSELRGTGPSIRDARLKSISVGDQIVSEVVKPRGRNCMRLSEKRVHDDILMHQLPLTEPVNGVVNNVVEYGAFIYFEQWGAHGLLHAKEIPGRSRSERDAYLAELTPDDEISVFVKEIVREGGRLQIWLTLHPFDPARNTVVEEEAVADVHQTKVRGDNE